MKQIKKKEMVIKDGCQTLREFLVSKSFKLSSYNIPYEDLSKILRNKWKRKESQQAKCNKSKIDEEIIGKIVQKIQFLEWNVLYGKLLDAASNGTKFFICAYILYNLQFFLPDYLNIMKNLQHSDKLENDNATKNSMELSTDVEMFLETSTNTTHCLENYVGKHLTSKDSMESNFADCLAVDKRLSAQADVCHEREIKMRKKKIEMLSSKLLQQTENSIELKKTAIILRFHKLMQFH